MSLLFQPWTWSSQSTGLQLCPGKVRGLKWMGKRAFKLFGISTYFLSRFLRWRSHLLAECRKLKIEFSCQVFQQNWALISWFLVWQEWFNGQKRNKTIPPRQKSAHAHKINWIREDPCKNQKCPTGTLSNLKSVINFTLPGKHLVVIKQWDDLNVADRSGNKNRLQDNYLRHTMGIKTMGFRFQLSLGGLFSQLWKPSTTMFSDPKLLLLEPLTLYKIVANSVQNCSWIPHQRKIICAKSYWWLWMVGSLT